MKMKILRFIELNFFIEECWQHEKRNFSFSDKIAKISFYSSYMLAHYIFIS